MRLFASFRAQQSGVEKSVLNRFLHFGPLRGPPVEMTEAQILNTIGLNSFEGITYGLQTKECYTDTQRGLESYLETI